MTSLRVDVQLDQGSFTLDAAFETDALVTGLFGPSGAGKSTIINIVAGLKKPDRGSLRLGDEVLLDTARGVDLRTHRRRIGVVFQEHRLFPHMSVAGNLRFGLHRRSPADERLGIGPVADLLELKPLLDRRPDQLSGGEAQRVALGRALVSNPRLLLLDEPLASLDTRLKQQIIPFLKRVRDELRIPMLLVSHDLAEVLQLTDRIVVLRRGRVAGAGRYRDLIAADDDSAVFDDDDLTNILMLDVIEHRPRESNTLLRLSGVTSAGEVIGPPTDPANHGPVVATIDPSDIALASGPVPAVSIQNQVQGTVRRVTHRRRFALAEVDIGATLFVRISLRSADLLKIAPGRDIVCLFKSNALRYRDAAPFENA